MSLIRVKLYLTQEEYDDLMAWEPPPDPGDPPADPPLTQDALALLSDQESRRIRHKLGWKATPIPKEPKDKERREPTPTPRPATRAG
jgi:hypothetical protein